MPRFHITETNIYTIEADTLRDAVDLFMKAGDVEKGVWWVDTDSRMVERDPLDGEESLIHDIATGHYPGDDDYGKCETCNGTEAEPVEKAPWCATLGCVNRTRQVVGGFPKCETCWGGEKSEVGL